MLGKNLGSLENVAPGLSPWPRSYFSEFPLACVEFLDFHQNL